MPNVLFIVLDDNGFGQLGCFGGPIETPNLDSLSTNGLRYNNMHTTARTRTLNFTSFLTFY
ncbi:sulfatase-like hydrolase/transferase [[Eubacterium] cellulosolvens]